MSSETKELEITPEAVEQMFPLVPRTLEPHQGLPPTRPKDFLESINKPLPPPKILAEEILAYFMRASDGVVEQEIVKTDGTSEKISRYVHSKIPLLSEVARLFGLTKSELFHLGKMHPETVGRAIDAAVDIADEYITHGTLEGRFHPSAAALVGPHVSRIVPKATVKVEDQSRRLSRILDEVEQNAQPYAKAE